MEKMKIAISEERLAQLKKIGAVLQLIWQWAYKLRSVILSVPVVAISIKLAIQNLGRLPVYVGINMQASGEYSMMIERSVAVLVPLLVTAACLLMMFLSKKVLYPWLVSLFSLLLPILLWITNVFPG